MPDGLWGISLHLKKIKWLSHLVYEYLQTTDQSMSWAQDKNANEPDNYFNHSYYLNGWTYKDYTIGNPLITSPALIKQLGIPTDITFDYLRNNKLIAHHFGCKGFIHNINYKFYLTYSRNMGTYHAPFLTFRESLSSYIEFTKQFERFFHIEASLVIANDFGSMYKNNGSVLLTIRKRGFLFN
jgi:hypothetical protein